MRIGSSIALEPVGRVDPPATVVDRAVAAEAEGFDVAWTVHFTRGADALAVLAAAAAQTSRITLAVGVVPTYPRHPAALAQQAMTVQALSGGRLWLGVGVSHRPVIEGALGLATASPLEHLREYLSVLVPLVRTGSVDHQGELYRTTLSVAVPGADPVPVLVGALSPASAALAASHADGIVTWLAGPETLGSVLVPAVREGHAAGGGAVTPDGRPVVAAALPVAVTDDPAGYRSAAKEIFGRYATLENYQRLFAREGVGGVEDLAVVGGEAEVEDRLRALADLGVTDLWPVVFGPEGADLQDGARTEALLRSLVG